MVPYEDIADLPPGVRAHLPGHAQEIYLAAFNRAWQQHADDARREEIAHRIAWAAVKRVYEKVGGRWVPR